jgi:hypothetical protein
MLVFRPVAQYREGLLASFLHQCYAIFLSDETRRWTGRLNPRYE